MSESSEKVLRSGMLFAMGNPLLDISVITNNDDLLNKYDLKPNNAILAEEKHMPLYKELVDQFNVEYIAGGSGLNSLRVAQWILQKPNVTIMTGCVGKDEFGTILEKKAIEDGVNVKFQFTETKPTGTCAVIITKNGADRSLCANLAAAECFTIDHIRQPDIKKYIMEAEVYYSSGFFLTVSIESILEVAQISFKRGKTYLMNLSAPFLPQFFMTQMMRAMPYIDILFGNETEALTFAKEQNFGTEDLNEIALKIAKLPKENPKKERVVVITQGASPVIVAENGKTKEIEVTDIPAEKVIDTNGAGDAFVGGFMSQLIKGQPIEKCVLCGIWTATEIIQRSGCTFKGKPSAEW